MFAALPFSIIILHVGIVDFWCVMIASMLVRKEQSIRVLVEWPNPIELGKD